MGTAPHRKPGVGAVTLLLLTCATPLMAHDFWIQPTAFGPKEGALVGVRLMVGQDLLGDPVPRDPEAIERFVSVRGSLETPVVGRDGSDPAGIIRIDRSGLLIVAYHSRPRAIELPPETFNQYLGEEGLDAIKRIWAGSNRRAGKARELFSRCAKALLVSGTPSTSDRDRALGLPLELVAAQNPYTASAGQDFSVTLLYRGKPQSGALVIAQNAAAPGDKLSVRSDDSGRATFRLPRGGAWLIKAVHMIPTKPGAGADWESFWASLTFELPMRPAASE